MTSRVPCANQQEAHSLCVLLKGLWVFAAGTADKVVDAVNAERWMDQG